jgi:hypothetical protein
MFNSSTAHSFPPGTRFFSLDGVLFAHEMGDHWYTINASGSLVKLDPNNSPGSPGTIFTGDRIRAPEFYAALTAENRQRA